MDNNLKKINDLIIDENLFDLGFAENVTPNECNGYCCKDGVFLSLEEKKIILENAELIKQYMDETQTKDESNWFENAIIEDEDFPNGLCDGTQVFNDKCVFLNKDGRCVLQILALDNGWDKWKIKPFYCIAFPLVIENKKLTYDDLLLDKVPCCTAKKGLPVNILEACKEELLHILGKDSYLYLTKIVNSNKKR